MAHFDLSNIAFTSQTMRDIIDRFNEIGFDPFLGNKHWEQKVDLEFFHNRKLMVVRDTAGCKEITFY